MKVSTEKIPESQVLMTIEVESERLDDARKKAVRKLAPKAKVPGFRPGKAPPDMVLRYFGEERVLDEALDDLVPVLYREAVLADETIDPVARPRLVVETTEPLVVKATIPVRPTVDLGDYTAVRVTPEEPAVDEARVDETLLTLRRRAATLEPVERPIGWRDIVRLDVRASVGDATLIEQQEAEIQLVEGRPTVFPGFEEAIIGKTKGDDREFDLAVPETVSDEQFRGKQAHFVVHIIETKEEVLPELDDDFLKAIGEGFDSLDALRDRIRDDITRAERDQIENRYHDEIMRDLVERATIEYPPVMLDAEIDRLLHDQAGHIERGEDLERYLAGIGKTEEQVREELRPVADTRLRRSLVLSQVAETEDIQVSADDVAAEIDTLSASAGPQAGQMRELFGSERGRETIARTLLTRKTLARLVEVATQDGAPPAIESPSTAKPRPARKKKSAKPAVAEETNAAASAETPAEEPAAQ